MSSVPKPKMTSQEYLRLERAETRDRHFFWRGEMYAMSGATPAHVLLAANRIGAHLDMPFRIATVSSCSPT